nr:Chain K, PEPTIDE [Homo sapiens]
AANATAA